MRFEVLLTKEASPDENMQTDLALLQGLVSDPRCILHFYGWTSTCATYGYFIDPWKFFKRDILSSGRLSTGRRPTGGGLIFHHADLAFSVLIPASHPGYSINTLSNYALVNQAVIQAIYCFLGRKTIPHLQQEDLPCVNKETCHFCMAKPTQYDVLLEGLKVAGGAQRRTKHGFLHQGTIALTLPTADFLKEVLIAGDPAAYAMQQNSYPLLESSHGMSLEEGRFALKEQLIRSLLGVFQTC
jgi:lipoate---protein ligase